MNKVLNKGILIEELATEASRSLGEKVRLENLINGKCFNETDMHVVIYGPNNKNDGFHNSLYVLKSRSATPSDFDCDGVYIPQGFRAKFPGGTILDGPFAAKYDDLKRIQVSSYEGIPGYPTYTILTAPNAIFKPEKSGCNDSDKVCWAIPSTFNELQTYGPADAPTAPLE
ncbi:hypothetical protein [Paenibacillus borealis]|uniref:Uncharacterized protein n=1 Tax=Paenibacillus borealis TaxID=160799 RepID=A0A089LFF3_PAEBO|nr:hypothetical protein [Paenibacillus borealis]AIQ58820.1 hypothetical protein PBOR_19185 [Paenibacillus borealis]